MASAYRFGPFELDLDRGELRRDGEPVKISPQPFKALTIFVSRAGELVTRDELRRALWVDDNFVDFNVGVNFCIAQLRVALDDPAARSAYLVAVPKRGYRFVATIDRVREAAPIRIGKSPLAAAAAGLAVATAAWAVFSAGGGSLPPLEARRYYELGAVALADAAPAELRNRVRFFDRAIALHPTLSDAHTGLADAWMTLGAYRATEHPISAYASAKAAAARAVELSPDSADAHAMLGASRLYYDWDWPGAYAELSRALALDPQSARAHAWMSRYQSASGRHEEAIAHAREADRLQPGSPSARTALGMALFYGGRFTDAETVYWRERLAREESAIREADPKWQSVGAAIAAAHAGDTARALQWLERAVSRRIDQVIYTAVHPAFKDMRDEPRFSAVLERIGAPH